MMRRRLAIATSSAAVAAMRPAVTPCSCRAAARTGGRDGYNRPPLFWIRRVNPRLASLQPYPFEKLRALMAGIVPPADKRPISLSIGEPKHAPPPLIRKY